MFHSGINHSLTLISLICAIRSTKFISFRLARATTGNSIHRIKSLFFRERKTENKNTRRVQHEFLFTLFLDLVKFKLFFMFFFLFSFNPKKFPQCVVASSRGIFIIAQLQQNTYAWRQNTFEWTDDDETLTSLIKSFTNCLHSYTFAERSLR